MRRTFPLTVLLPALACVALVSRTAASETVATPAAEALAELWSEPDDIASRDLLNGEGGPELAPDGTRSFVFLSEKQGGTSPGYTVKDRNGVTWDVKMGVEAQSEVAVSRLLWAIGFRQPPVYLLPSWTMQGGSRPGPKGVSRFRPALPGWKESGPWAWREGPLVGTPALKGLIAFMRIVNNWDILDRNNLVYALDPPRDGVRRFLVVKDLGASLGRTETVHQGSKNDVDGFEKQKYIEKVVDGAVHYEDRGRRHHDLYDTVRVEDVRWVSDLLAKLTEKQWEDAFKAAAYEPAVAARYIATLKKRVEEGRRLP